MPDPSDQRRTLVARLDKHDAAIMVTDMVGYSRRMHENEELALALLEEHNAIIREAIEMHGGFVAKVMGDAFLVEFFDPGRAVDCALAIQSRLAVRNASVPRERQVWVRIGLHYSQVTPVGQDIIGDGVNVVARIEPRAPPGGICLSHEIYQRAREQVGERARDLGPQTLKNIANPVHVFQIDPAGPVPEEFIGPPSDLGLRTRSGASAPAVATPAPARKRRTPVIIAGAGVVLAAGAAAGFLWLRPPARTEATVPPALAPPPAPAPLAPPTAEAQRPEPPPPTAEPSPARKPPRGPALLERARKVLARAERLPKSKQKKIAAELWAIRKAEKKLSRGKDGVDLDRLERQIATVERHR